MRGMLLMAAAMTACAAAPAAANWGYSNGGANYGNASYGGGSYANAGYGGYGYGYGYANLSQHGAALPSWGDCPCCAGAWDSYCEEKAARAAKRHCNSCGTGCGRVKHLGRKCGKACDSCGSTNGCGCNGEAASDAAPAVEPAPTTDQPTPPPPPSAAPEASAAAPAADASTRAKPIPVLPGFAWLMSLSWSR